MGIFTYLKIGLAVAVLAVCGYYVFNYEHMKTKIAAQQAQIDSLKSKQQVLDDNQKATKDIVDKLAKIKGRATGEKTTMHQEAVTEPDNYINFTQRYRVRPDDQAGPPKDGKGAGYLKSKTRPKALPAPN
jgi:hypothetical protein